MSLTKITTPELLDFPNDSISSANTSGTVIPTGYTNACNFPTFSSGVGLYQFENNATNTCTGITGTETNITYTTGNFNQAAVFNGTTSGVKIGDIFGGGVTTDFSFSVSQWINFTNLPPTSGANYWALLGRDTTFGGAYPIIELYIYNTGGGVCTSSLQKNFNGSFYYNSGYNSTAAPYTFTTSTWYNHVITYDSSSQTTTLYIDGVKIGDYVLNTPASTYTFVPDLVIGSYDGSTNSFDGKIDQVRFYNKILSSSQITELYNETTTEVYRPTTSLNAGEFRFNTTTGYVEYYDGSAWQQIADEYITGQPTSCICNYPTTAVALYEFQDNTNDTCGGSAGTLYGTPTYVPGNFGKAIDFNGTNQGITLPSILPANSSSSSSATLWFKTSDTTGAQQTLIEAWDGTTGNDGAWALWKDVGNVLRLGNYYLNGSNVGTDGSTNIADGNWHFIAVVFDYSGATLSLYLDGNSTPEVQFTGLTPGTVNIFSGSSALGYQIQGGPFRYFPGSMDQFRVFPIALSQTQITELYNEVVCN